MIATLLSVILLLYAIIQYSKGHYAKTLFILLFFATNAFIINFGEPIVKYTDLGLLLLLVCSFLGWLRDPSFFRLKSFSGAKISVALLLFFTIEFLYSYFDDIDTTANILSVLRGYLYALSYFVFRKMSFVDIQKSILLVYKVVILSCLIFVIQYITQLPLTSTYVSGADNGIYRMQITPPFIDIIFFMLLLFVKKNKWKWSCIILIFVVQLLSQNRTPLIAWLFELSLFVALAKNYCCPIKPTNHDFGSVSCCK